MIWGFWIDGEWNEEEPACVRCHRAMSLRDDCEWSDYEELNLCHGCAIEVLEEIRAHWPFARQEKRWAKSLGKAIFWMAVMGLFLMATSFPIEKRWSPLAFAFCCTLAVWLATEIPNILNRK